MADRVNEKDTSFLPRNTALVLQKASEANKEAQREVSARLASIEAQNERLLRHFELFWSKDHGGGAALRKAHHKASLARMAL